MKVVEVKWVGNDFVVNNTRVLYRIHMLHEGKWYANPYIGMTHMEGLIFAPSENELRQMVESALGVKEVE